MAALPWSDTYLVNVAVIDDQHRRLAELVNRLHAYLEAGEPGTGVYNLLTELIGFTRLHFATEEELMLKHEYPDYATHRAAHKEVLAQLLALLARFQDRLSVDFEPSNDIDDDWVTRHLLERDLDLGRFLNTKGIY
jgi:hemerythrin-like metal-binding protein